MNNVTAILTSDWHIRDTKPECRIDDFESAQWDKIRFISKLQKVYKCPVIHAGDLFHHWKPSPYLLAKTIEYLPDQFFTVYGQHDLPQHNMELKEKSGIYVLEKAGKLTVLRGTHWGQKPVVLHTSEVPIIVWHKMVWKGQEPYPGAPGDGEAYKVLRKLHKKARLILTGDNHQTFTATHGDCVLVNPGNITRQTADQIKFRPSVFLWYGDTNALEQVYLPISSDVVSREHIERKQARNGRIDAFIQRLNGDLDDVDFESNMNQYMEKNRGNIRSSVISIIYNAMEE